jgi:hypothetical protein
MDYTRTLIKGMVGQDVRYMKDCLFTMKYYPATIKKITNDVFGNDTYKAVKKFQKNNIDATGAPLKIDGIIGRKTWDSIVNAFNHY